MVKGNSTQNVRVSLSARQQTGVFAHSLRDNSGTSEMELTRLFKCRYGGHKKTQGRRVTLLLCYPPSAIAKGMLSLISGWTRRKKKEVRDQGRHEEVWERGVDRGVQSEERSARLSFGLGELSFALSHSRFSPSPPHHPSARTRWGFGSSRVRLGASTAR